MGSVTHLSRFQENALVKLNAKCVNDKFMYCQDAETIEDPKYAYETKLRCMNIKYFQFLRVLPFDESYLFDNSTWNKLSNCIYSVPETSLVTKVISIPTHEEDQTVCPWEWTSSVPERSQEAFPPKRMFAKCKCHRCQHIGEVSSSSSCKPKYTLKPMLLKMKDGRWKFYMERVSVTCSCTKNRQHYN